MQKTSYPAYSFDDFTVDLARCCLLRGKQQVKLRPKPFEVLKYLVENRGRLVSKEELIQAIWPDSFVTDDSLVQCLVEVRRALEDDSQQYIKTVSRRGYIFEAQVVVDEEGSGRGGEWESGRAGEHIWAETYDHELKDVFEVQSDVANQIATALRAKFSATEKNGLGRNPQLTLQLTTSISEAELFTICSASRTTSEPSNFSKWRSNWTQIMLWHMLG